MWTFLNRKISFKKRVFPDKNYFNSFGLPKEWFQLKEIVLTFYSISLALSHSSLALHGPISILYLKIGWNKIQKSIGPPVNVYDYWVCLDWQSLDCLRVWKAVRMLELKKRKQSGVQIRNVFAELDESVRVSGVNSYVYENICMVEQMAYGSQLSKNMTF